MPGKARYCVLSGRFRDHRKLQQGAAFIGLAAAINILREDKKLLPDTRKDTWVSQSKPSVTPF